jgi:hypothetical protein
MCEWGGWRGRVYAGEGGGSAPRAGRRAVASDLGEKERGDAARAGARGGAPRASSPPLVPRRGGPRRPRALARARTSLGPSRESSLSHPSSSSLSPATAETSPTGPSPSARSAHSDASDASTYVTTSSLYTARDASDCRPPDAVIARDRAPSARARGGARATARRASGRRRKFSPLRKLWNKDADSWTAPRWADGSIDTGAADLRCLAERT